MPFVETLAPFFADFGEDATLDGEPVRVIFDNLADQLLGGTGVAAQVPQVQIASASVPASVYGLPLVLRSTTYTVREHVPDGTGLSLLTLSRS